MSRMTRVDRSEPVRAEGKTRTPVSSSRSPLKVTGFDHKNYNGRWVANLEGRIEDFLAGGYELVRRGGVVAGESTVDSSSGLDNCVTKPGGRGITLYLMRIPKKFYLEDQAAKAKEVDASEEAIKRPRADYGKMSLGSRQGKENLDFEDVEKLVDLE